ncbi:MAG TPA: hypothetical protein VLT33_28595 [Labilithrix sp.]|nr:hypothetical protein [Labilithrix sp.]
MRRPLLFLALCAVAIGVGCGIDAVATKSFDVPPDAGGDETGVNLPPKTDGGDDAAPDAPVDAPLEADAARPDAGIVFVPSHIQPVYSLTAPSVTVTSETFVDTTNLTLALNGAAAATSADLVLSDGVAIWSVDTLTTTARLRVVGGRALVIVARHDVTIGDTVSAFGTKGTPGPGGAAPAVGSGKGTNGTKTGNDASGGGGAGHGTAGAPGGDKAAVKGGALGGLANAAGALLVGGSGGGHGGGYAAGVCAGRGRGGAGGGALQISAVGTITVAVGGGIDVGGGGGGGGCKDNGGDKYSGGGGGGAGGLVYLEAVGGIDIVGTLEASGGGGGEGGTSNNPGFDGDDGLFPPGPVLGGSGSGNGGNGGNGGVGGGVATPPGAGSPGGDTGGGGGGAMGRVFLRTRGVAPTVLGVIAAQRTDESTF